jgi:hypothetical protein
VLALTAISVGGGMVFLVPSLYWMFRVFKR